MGVPSFYRWLINKYPKVVKDVDATNSNPNDFDFDNLYLDANAIIHPCFHPEDIDENSPLPATFENVFNNVFDYVDCLVDVVRPRKLLYMAIDGVTPRAKMNQQRSRRFQTAKDNEIREAEEGKLRKQFEIEGKQVLPFQESEVSDSNVITPGTEFMHELSKALKSYISSRIANNPLWMDIMVILSDDNVPGEGEHKIMSYIRAQRGLIDYDPNTKHCLYGSDADLIMLGMATHEPYFSILREDAFVKEPKQQISPKSFKLLHIWLLRECLEIDMKIEDLPKNCSFDLERIVDDFVFLCFFAGNDFLPHMPSLEIHEGAIDLLMTVYKKEFNKLGGYLVDISRIGEKKGAFLKLSRVEKFILMVGSYEEQIFKKRSEIRERRLRRLIEEHEDAKKEEQNDLDNESSSDCTLVIKNAPDFRNSSIDILQNTNEFKGELKRCLRQKNDLFKSGEFLIDRIKLGTSGYKERYYEEKFSVDGANGIECQRKELVKKYTEGLLWVLQYYFSGVASWTWFYPFHYGPFASDLKGMGQVMVNFEKGEPFLPFDQLLGVLPPRSSSALPKAYAQLMLDEHSKIIDFYPQDFEVDIEGKRFMWQGICKVPWIDERRLLAESRELKKYLSENEATRNSEQVDRLFVRSVGKLAEKICSLNLTSKLDTTISEGIGGVISHCHECVEKPCLGMEICDNKQEDYVLCVYYELPASSNNHIPRLLPGVNFPEKTIFEYDIEETKLWHEPHQKYNRFGNGRVQCQDNWRRTNIESSSSKFGSNASKPSRSFSSDISTEVIYKGACVGWGEGRGKPTTETKSYLSPFHKQPQDTGSYQVPAMRDTRSQHFEDNFRQLRISESNHQFRPYNNGFRNQSNNASSYHQGPSQSQTMPFGRGQGRFYQGSRPYNNDFRNQSNNASSYHQVPSQSQTMPFGRGQGRFNQGSFKNVSTNNSVRSQQWNGTRKDESRW